MALSYDINHGADVPKRNFGFEKRQKEQARQAKKQEKLAEREQRRQDRAAAAGPPAEAEAAGVEPSPTSDQS
jgi:hypothetical protein